MTNYIHRARYALLLVAFASGAAVLLVIYGDLFQSLPLLVQAILVVSVVPVGVWLVDKDRSEHGKR